MDGVARRAPQDGQRLATFLLRYGWLGTFRLLRDLLYTRLIFRRGARLVRLPFFAEAARWPTGDRG